MAHGCAIVENREPGRCSRSDSPSGWCLYRKGDKRTLVSSMQDREGWTMSWLIYFRRFVKFGFGGSYVHKRFSLDVCLDVGFDFKHHIDIGRRPSDALKEVYI